MQTTRQPLPAGEHKLIALTFSLVSPVVRGLLPRVHAEVAIPNATRLDAKAGHLRYEPFGYARILQHILILYAQQAATRRTIAEGEIRRALEPLIAIKARSGRLLAVAHDINGDAGFVLAEDEVTELVDVLIWHAVNSSRGDGVE